MVEAPNGNVSSLETWAQTLSDELAGIDVIYTTYVAHQRGLLLTTEEEEELLGINGGVVDPAQITHQAARAVSRVIEALGALPQFHNQGLVTLCALRTAVASLDEGNKPQLLAPRQGLSVGADHVGREVYKANVIECVRLLEVIGLSNSKARKLVAEVFGQAGHRGKSRRPLSAATLFNWQTHIYACDAAPDIQRLKFRIEERLSAWKADSKWPPTVDEALGFVRKRAINPTIAFALTI